MCPFYGYFNAIEFSAYLFIHLHFQCSCTFTFTFSHLADAFVQSDVQGRELVDANWKAVQPLLCLCINNSVPKNDAT